MGFWIFMLLMDLLIPIIMIAVGASFLKAAPTEINYIYGYRTSRSMKNRDTWEFAHHYCGLLWLWLGSILLPVSVIPMLFVIGKSIELVGAVGAIVCTVDTLVVLFSILPTELALKKNFDKDGNRKK